MANIVQFPGTEVQAARPRMIQRPAAVKIIGGDFVEEVVQPRSQKAEPIKSAEDIQKVTDYLIANGRYRDNLLFICGINFGLRIGDLLRLKVGHLLNPDGGSYRTQITIKEEKTDKLRIVYPNDAVMDAADLYFSDLQRKREPIDLNDYLFRNLSHNKTRTIVERDEGGNVTGHQYIGIHTAAQAHQLLVDFLCFPVQANALKGNGLGLEGWGVENPAAGFHITALQRNQSIGMFQNPLLRGATPGHPHLHQVGTGGAVQDQGSILQKGTKLGCRKHEKASFRQNMASLYMK